MSNDAFYFGVLPILSEAAAGLRHQRRGNGARLADRPAGAPASLLVPSTHLLVGLAGVEFGETTYALKWATMICLVMLAAALAFGCLWSAVG